jgi:hypothetical protein
MFKREKWKKYNSSITIINWISFKSKIEARFYQYFIDNGIEIEEMQPAFILQHKFEFDWQKHREVKYVADFIINVNWYKIIVEVKWFATPEFKLKKKLFLFKLKDWMNSNNIKYIIVKSLWDFEKQIQDMK